MESATLSSSATQSSSGGALHRRSRQSVGIVNIASTTAPGAKLKEEIRKEELPLHHRSNHTFFHRAHCLTSLHTSPPFTNPKLAHACIVVISAPTPPVS
jgi:hypothetical protein